MWLQRGEAVKRIVAVLIIAFVVVLVVGLSLQYPDFYTKEYGPPVAPPSAYWNLVPILAVMCAVLWILNCREII